jgi:BON domain-containing protein
MGFPRGIGRLAAIAAAGLAAGWYLRRQAKAELAAGGLQPAEAERAPQSREPTAPPPDEPMDAHVEAVEAVSDAADVTSVVEDLLAVAPGEEAPDLAEAVRATLDEVPGLRSESMRVESSAGVVWLRGELERPEAISEAGRRAASVPGVSEVRNLLNLPGAPPASD